MVPSDWKIASLEHNYSSYKVSFFKRMHLCTCGASGFSIGALRAAHYRIEMETRKWLETIEANKARRSAESLQKRQENLRKYEEFKAGLQQTGSPGSDSFYRS